MNTITTNRNVTNLYAQSSSQITNDQEQSKVHHHKKISEDLIAISNQGLQQLGNSQATSSNPIDDSLSSLVSDGTITQDQSDAIKQAFQSRSTSIQQSGTYGSKPTNPLDTLVSNGTITKDQEKSVQAAFKNAMKPKDDVSTDDTQNDPFTTTLDSLVSSGTITSDQETSIENALKSAMESNSIGNDNTQNDPFTTTLDSLVSSGTITTDQETSIEDAMNLFFEQSTNTSDN